jgi:ATP-dependent Clp protease ATP-binding subunit ClpA
MNNLTPHAQEVLALARKEADRFHHNFVGTEHLLLGLISLGQGTAVTVLGKMGLDLETVRTEVEKMIGTGPDQKMIGNIPYTPRVKRVLSLAAKEARAFNHTYVGTEHILLGLLLEGDGVAARVLKNLGVDTEKTRLEILRELNPNFAGTAEDIKPFEMPQNADLPKPRLDSIDTSKRYDVYCSEGDQQVVVYRNALFKGWSKLLSTRQLDFGIEFLELEQSNGQTVYLSQFSVLRFCEHGAEIVGEIIPPQ